MATNSHSIAPSTRSNTISGVANTNTATFQRHRWKFAAPASIQQRQQQQQTINDYTTTMTMTTTTTTTSALTTRYSTMLPASAKRCQYEPRHIVSLNPHCDADHRDHYNQHNQPHTHQPPMLPTSSTSSTTTSSAQLQPLRCCPHAIPSNLHSICPASTSITSNDGSCPAALAQCWRCSGAGCGIDSRSRSNPNQCVTALATVGLMWTLAIGVVRTICSGWCAEGVKQPQTAATIGNEVMRCMRTLLPLLLVLNMLPMLFAGMF